MQVEQYDGGRQSSPKLWPWSRVKSRDGDHWIPVSVSIYGITAGVGVSGLLFLVPRLYSWAFHLTTKLDSAQNDPAAAINWQLEHTWDGHWEAVIKRGAPLVHSFRAHLLVACWHTGFSLNLEKSSRHDDGLDV